MNNSFKRAFSCVMVLLFLFSAAPLCAVSAVGDGAASRRVRVGGTIPTTFRKEPEKQHRKAAMRMSICSVCRITRAGSMNM